MRNFCLFCILFASALTPITSQSQINEFGLWVLLGIEKNINKWRVEANGNIRSKDDSKQLDRLSLEIEGSYSICKAIKIGTSYEYIHFHDTKFSDFQPRNRFSGFIKGKHKFGRFSFILTEQIQLTTKDESDRIKSNGTINTYRINPALTWRNKLKISYNIRNCSITPTFAIESYYSLNNPEGNAFYKMRYTIDLSYRLNKKQSLRMFNLIDKEMNINNPSGIYIIGIGYNYAF